MSKEKETNKKQKSTKESLKNKKPAKPRINYKQKWQTTKIKLQQVELNLIEQKRENEANILAFQQKAQGFQKKAQEEVNKIKDKLEINMKREHDLLKKYGSQKLIEAIIDPLINIEVAVKSGKNNDHVKAYVVGFEMLLMQLYQELETFGIVKIEPQIGDNFDAVMHYALETKKGKHKNKIVAVKKPGFKLHDRVLKPATVIINL